MEEQTLGAPRRATLALHVPEGQGMDRRLFVALPLAIVAVQVVTGGVDLLLAAALDRMHWGVEVTTYGWITGIASLCALLAYPLAGLASDRTPASFRRRTTWVLAGSIGSAIGLVGVAGARTVDALAATYVVAFACLPVAAVALYASISDRVAASNRGAIGAAVGAATIVGGVAGNLLAARFAQDTQLGAIVFVAVLACGGAVFLVVGRETTAAIPRPPTSSSPSAETSQLPAGGRSDLAWLAIGRFAYFLGYAAVTGLAYYVLRDRVGLASPADGVAAFALASGITTLIASILAGPWSDRLARRKPFVIASGLLLALGAAIPLVSATFTAFLVAGAVIGLGFGTYLAVGTALATLVLPSPESAGRDMGFVGLANAFAQVVAPVAGSYAVSVAGYQALFVGASAACLLGVLAAFPIRSVR